VKQRPEEDDRCRVYKVREKNKRRLSAPSAPFTAQRD
jgi:hypothetical protein